MGVVATTLAATLCMQLGFFLWKLSAHADQPRIGTAPARRVIAALLGDWRWVAGSAASALGWVLFIRATSIGEISVIQPLMSAGDMLLVLLAVAFLKERLGRREVLGLAVTVAGALGLALGAQKVPGAAWAWAELGPFVLLAAGAAGTLVWSVRLRARKEVPLALAVGLCFGSGAVLTEAWTAATVPGLFALLHPTLWLMVAANMAGLVLLQAAFQRGRASVVVPVQLAAGNALAVGGGAWLYGEALPLERLASVALIVAGAALLQGRAAKPPAGMTAPSTPETANTLTP